jgi:hypothetical protein
MNLDSVRNGMYVDAEFNCMDLISIAVVSPEEEYYAIVAEVDQEKILADQWLVENVWSTLPIRDGRLDSSHPDVKSRVTIASDLGAYFKRHEGRTLWGWCPAYDKVLLDGVFGGMFASEAPMYCHDVETLRLLLGNPELPKREDGLHNALKDARYQRDLGLWLADRLEEELMR